MRAFRDRGSEPLRPLEADRWVRVRGLLERLVELPASDREAALHEACGDDEELVREVRELLDQDTRLGSFLEPPVVESVHERSAAGMPAGRSVGRWRVERMIGRGGMGEVYLAAQGDEPSRRVALKVIRAGARGEDVARRFRRERSLLARLRHPGIARLIEGGVSEDGLPFLVMEHVEGEPLDRWCERRRPTLRERLELFLRVCAAVQHAHRCLVVHRDLKPGNILVDAGGEPHLLDFGIAKLLAPEEGEEESLQTATGEGCLTPLYASPEQLRQQPVTASSDVYSLGVLLYELLSGERPYDLAGRSLAECERIVCGRDPEPPSRRAGRAGPGEPRRRALAGDLDTIVLEALRQEPERRYPSVHALARDIELHLAGQPITARPDTLRYRTVKLVRRHAWLTGAVAGAFLALAAGLLISLAMLTRAQEAGRGEELANRKAQGLVAVLEEQVRRAERARDAERAERRRADGLLEDLLESSMANVFEFGRQLEDLPGMRSLREDMVENTVEMLAKLAPTAPSSRDLQLHLVRSLVALGEVQAQDVARPTRALESFRRALERGQVLVAREPAWAAEVEALLEPCHRALAEGDG